MPDQEVLEKENSLLAKLIKENSVYITPNTYISWHILISKFKQYPNLKGWLIFVPDERDNAN